MGSLLFTFDVAEIRGGVGMAGFQERASEGGVLVLVRYTVRNNSNVPVPAYTIPDITLIDPAGIACGPDAGKTGAYTMEGGVDQKLWSDLNPGITTRAAEVFEVSRASFDPGAWRIVINGHPVQITMMR